MILLPKALTYRPSLNSDPAADTPVTPASAGELQAWSCDAGLSLHNDDVTTDDEQGDAIDEDETNDPDDKDDSKYSDFGYVHVLA